jgi:hypothetical protein
VHPVRVGLRSGAAHLIVTERCVYELAAEVASAAAAPDVASQSPHVTQLLGGGSQ